MRRYEDAVDVLVGPVPDYEYTFVGLDVGPTLSTREFAKSLLMPGHLFADIYEGDAEAVAYGVQAGYFTAGALSLQLAITGTISERALYGIAQGFKKAPITILAFEAGYQVSDIERTTRGDAPKSLTLRGVRKGALYLTRSRKTGKDVRSFKFMERS